MKSLSGLGLGLSLVFGCLLFALVAELYYLLWWKKKRISSKRESGEEIENGKTTDLFHHKSCWRNPSLSLSSPSSSTLRSETQVHEPTTTVHFHGENGDSNKEFWYKHNRENGDGEEDEEDDDDELMRLQNMGGGGLPRFLFTIKEETKEEMMESEEDGKSSRDRSRKGSRSRRSLSDLFHVMEITTNTPYLTPIASPPYFTPPLTPIRTVTTTETAMAAEFNWLSSSCSSSSFSPPPNFQFLRDAEKKHHGRKKLSDELEIVDRKGVFREDEINGSFITLLVARRNREEEQHSPTTSQVLPLSSSPPSPSPPPPAGKPKLTTSSSSSSSSSKSHHIPFSSFSRNSIK